ncbi:MAG: DUF1127 domain-containing protein [Rhizobiales bacterium]|nr:DUF1127 domain-containing protein [Hyphomicrobiales bacterium]
MTTIEQSHFAIHAARPAVSARVVNLVAKLYRTWQNRRAVYRLGELSDTELADIGLRRSDLYVAIQTPFGADPTERLGVIAEARSMEVLARQVY